MDSGNIRMILCTDVPPVEYHSTALIWVGGL